MTDRDKVIKWLEMCPGILECTDNPRTECPYEENGCVGDLKAEALTLLKEQEQTINALESDLKETLEELASKGKEQEEFDAHKTPIGRALDAGHIYI